MSTVPKDTNEHSFTINSYSFKDTKGHCGVIHIFGTPCITRETNRKPVEDTKEIHSINTSRSVDTETNVRRVTHRFVYVKEQ